jgi:anti-anti-sigma regulatory factor
MDAAGIAALITLYCTSVQAGTEFFVVDPSAHVLELLQIVGLESILISDERPTGSARSCLDRSAA